MASQAFSFRQDLWYLSGANNDRGLCINGVLSRPPFQSLIHHPNDFAVESAPTTLLKTGTETFIAIYPTDSRCSSQVLDLPQSQRNCINAADYSHLDTYRQPACILECLRDAIHKECKCHPYHLPQVLTYGRQRQLKECTVLDALCFVNNYGNFNNTYRQKFYYGK